MKYFMLIALGLSFVLAGCTPKLADRELGPEEKEWKEYIEAMYPGWESPGTLPPAVSDRNEKNPYAAGKNDDDFGMTEVTDIPKDSNADKTGSKTAEDANNSLTGGNDEAETAKVRYDEYTVEKDDSLSLISKKVYGNGRKYYRIYKANEDIIKNKNKIYPGMKLRIPRP